MTKSWLVFVLKELMTVFILLDKPREALLLLPCSEVTPAPATPRHCPLPGHPVHEPGMSVRF